MTNPFFEAYYHSDFLGKLIFIALVFLSVCTWIIIIYKGWLTYKARKNAARFSEQFQEHKANPLNAELETAFAKDALFSSNPFFSLYTVLKKNTLELLKSKKGAYLSPSDIEIVEAHLSSTISLQVKDLEKNLFLLATIVTLGPFLGLLGTVWGILTTFSELQGALSGNTNQMVISGLSLALATTVLGLIDAIPALIGYNYLKNSIRDFEVDMEGFSTEILTTLELQYRKGD